MCVCVCVVIYFSILVVSCSDEQLRLILENHNCILISFFF